MKILLIGFLLLSTLASAQNASLAVGQCLAIPESKTYSKSEDQNLIRYQCTYSCRTQYEKIEKVVGAHVFDRRTQNEMFDLVCEGVKIGKVLEDGFWTYKPVEVAPFWALLSLSPQLREWAQTNKVFPPDSFIQENKLKALKNITALQTSFATIDPQKFPDFAKASTLLTEEIRCWNSEPLAMNCPLLKQATKAERSKDLAVQQVQAQAKILIELIQAGLKL